MTFSVLNYHAKYLFPFLWDVHFFLPNRNCFSLSELLLDNSTIVPLSLERFRVTFTAKENANLFHVTKFSPYLSLNVLYFYKKTGLI